MSWPQPTAQYGQTPWVTVAPRSRDVFFTVSRLYGWGLEATGRLDIGVSLSSEWVTRRVGSSFLSDREGRGGRPEVNAVGLGVDVDLPTDPTARGHVRMPLQPRQVLRHARPQFDARHVASAAGP